MPDPMSPDPEVVALSAHEPVQGGWCDSGVYVECSGCDWEKPDQRWDKDTGWVVIGPTWTEHVLAALHAAGYRVEAAESETTTRGGFYCYTQGHGDPDRCVVHGDIPGDQSIAGHVQEAHGLTYDHYRAQVPPDAPHHIPAYHAAPTEEERQHE